MGCDFSDLVVASAGDDKKISLWNKNGKSMGTIPVAGTDSGDNIEVIQSQLYNSNRHGVLKWCASGDNST